MSTNGLSAAFRNKILINKKTSYVFRQAGRPGLQEVSTLSGWDHSVVFDFHFAAFALIPRVVIQILTAMASLVPSLPASAILPRLRTGNSPVGALTFRARNSHLPGLDLALQSPQEESTHLLVAEFEVDEEDQA